uniref:Uncharacterized protein n=1 Tax=Pithovirus LCPAC201 TaxID=2506591 RepID=A0A481Z528_9VIRU|nr:MAG: hypothetical protein LCPAC201_02790 [Pithovirus LCPAC201]
MLTVANPTLVINHWPPAPIDESMGPSILNYITNEGYHVAVTSATSLQGGHSQKVIISLLQPSCNYKFSNSMIENPLKTMGFLSNITPIKIIEPLKMEKIEITNPPVPILSILTRAHNIKPAVDDKTHKCSCESCNTITKLCANIPIKKKVGFQPGIPRTDGEASVRRGSISVDFPAKPTKAKPTETKPTETKPVKSAKTKSDGTTINKSKESKESVRKTGMKLVEILAELVEQQSLYQRQFKEIIKVLQQEN